MYVKILNLLPQYHNEQNGKNDKVVDIASKLSYRAIKGICNSFKDLQQIKEEEINQLLRDEKVKISPRRLLINNDIFEIVLLYQRVKLLYLSRDGNKDKINDIYAMFNKMSYEISSSIYNRIYMLEFKSELNERLLFEILPKEKLENEEQLSEYMKKCGAEEMKKIIYYVINSVCNLQEVLKFVQIYGETYLITNYFIAQIHHKLMFWLVYKENLKISDEFLKPLEVPSSERANAIRAYYKAEELHNEGRTYKNMIERSCYLSDEYNDQRFHFLIAQERYYVNDCNYRSFKQMSHIKSSKKVYEVDQFIGLVGSVK